MCGLFGYFNLWQDDRKTQRKIKKHNRLKLALKKWKFLQTEVRYFGHFVNGDEVATDPDKRECIQNWFLP